MTAALDRWQARAERARQNRTDMPQCTAFIDAMRAAFGAINVHVRYASENEITYGKRGPEGVPAIQPDALQKPKAETHRITRYKTEDEERAPVAIAGELFAEAEA